MTELARQAADRVHGVASWLEQREPGDLLAEVRDYARRNPGTFLAGAALLGVLAGRLTRNIAAGGDGRHVAAGGDREHAAVSDRRAFESADTVPLDGYDNDRTAVLPTAAGTAAPGTPVPPARTEPGPMPPVAEADPLSGGPSTGTRP